MCFIITYSVRIEQAIVLTHNMQAWSKLKLSGRDIQAPPTSLQIVCGVASIEKSRYIAIKFSTLYIQVARPIQFCNANVSHAY